MQCTTFSLTSKPRCIATCLRYADDIALIICISILIFLFSNGLLMIDKYIDVPFLFFLRLLGFCFEQSWLLGGIDCVN